MNKLIKNISAVALAAGIVALPGAANAATATATGTATLTVTEQCSVTGATVDLGSYTTAQKWSDVGASLGSWDGTQFIAGSQGFEHLNWGSVTCGNGMAYTLAIAGSGGAGMIKLTVGDKIAMFSPHVKKLGTTAVADNNANAVGAGAQVNGGKTMSGAGTGAAQDLSGNVILNFPTALGGTALAADALGTAGSYTDTLTYTLTF